MLVGWGLGVFVGGRGVSLGSGVADLVGVGIAVSVGGIGLAVAVGVLVSVAAGVLVSVAVGVGVGVGVSVGVCVSLGVEEGMNAIKPLSVAPSPWASSANAWTSAAGISSAM